MMTFKKVLGFGTLLTCLMIPHVHAITLHGPQTFDNDDAADLSVYNFSNGLWLNFKSDGNVPFMKKWGWNAKWFIPAPADYDGDGLTDRAVYYLKKPGTWYIEQSTDSKTRTVTFGDDASLPVPHDYDGDGIIDIAVYRPRDGMWYIQKSSSGLTHTIEFGDKGMMPVPGYYNSTTKVDVAVYRFNEDTDVGDWYICRDLDNREDWYRVGGGTTAEQMPVPADYDGDNITDIAVYDPETGDWHIRQSRTSLWLDPVNFGEEGDVPVPDDYNGDLTIDIAVYRRSTGVWYIKDSSRTPLGTSVQPKALDYREINWGWNEMYPTHLQYQLSLWFDYVASKSDHLPIKYPPFGDGTLWKTPNHGGDGTVVLLASNPHLSEYHAGVWDKMVVASDPAGQNIVGGVYGIGRVVEPYHERPAIRFDKVGTYFGSSPVYMVLIYKDGRRQPWYIPNPGVRTE